MTKTLVWLHEDCLSPTDPALVANPGSPAVFVFDEPLLTRLALSFKRLFFIYECADEALAPSPEPEIRRGNVPDEVIASAISRGCDAIHVTRTDAPVFQQYLRDIKLQIDVVVHEQTPFVHYAGRARRFSQLWRDIERQALDYSVPPTPVLE